jgi:hypothetical protein
MSEYGGLSLVFWWMDMAVSDADLANEYGGPNHWFDSWIWRPSCDASLTIELNGFADASSSAGEDN